MKVTVNTYLNVRVGKPSLNAQCYQYLAPGSELDVDGKLYKGDSYDGIDTWYKDEAGNYYWSGGVNVIDYNKLLTQIPLTIRENKGKDIIVAIVDTGCIAHLSISNSVIHFYNAITKKEGLNFEDDNGHGSFIAGLIGSNGTNSCVIGVASNVKLIIVKASYKGSFFRENVLDGMNWLINICQDRPDIINMSFDFSPKNKLNEFKSVFEQAYDKGITMIAAGQDDENVLSSNSSFYFPAREDRIISVGAIQKTIPNNITLSDKINYVIPQKDDYCSITDLNDSILPRGSSFATAILSGVFSLIKSYQLLNSDPKITAKEHLDSLIPIFPKSPIFNQLKIFKS